ncbi:MAG: DsbE family thiol:disulfide interchange protein [Alphaproteobacteria bacterium]
MRYSFLIIVVFTFYIFYEALKKNPREIPSNLISKEIPFFTLSGLGGSEITEKELKNNDVNIVNFFASWCPPCRFEHPQLSILSKQIPIIGIAKKNDIDDLVPWLEELGNPYKKIGIDREGLISIDWGVYGLPETFIIDNNGVIKYKHVGPIMKDDLKKIKSIIEEIK